MLLVQQLLSMQSEYPFFTGGDSRKEMVSLFCCMVLMFKKHHTI